MGISDCGREPKPTKRSIAAQLDNELVLYCRDHRVPVDLFGEKTGMETQSLQASIQSQLDALRAKTAFFAKHLASAKTIAIHADDPLNTLSVIKLAIMVLAYRDAQAGTLDLDQRYQMRDDDFRRGSGVLHTFAPGLRPTYRDLVTQMIITSDTTATDILIARLGLARVNTMLAALGYPTTRLQTTIGQLFRRVWERLDPANSALSDRNVYERGFPTDPDAAARHFAFEGDRREWLGCTTARNSAFVGADSQWRACFPRLERCHAHYPAATGL